MGNNIGTPTHYNPLDSNIYQTEMGKILTKKFQKETCCLSNNSGFVGMELKMVGTDGKVYTKMLIPNPNPNIEGSCDIGGVTYKTNNNVGRDKCDTHMKDVCRNEFTKNTTVMNLTNDQSFYTNKICNCINSPFGTSAPIDQQFPHFYDISNCKDPTIYKINQWNNTIPSKKICELDKSNHIFKNTTTFQKFFQSCKSIYVDPTIGMTSSTTIKPTINPTTNSNSNKEPTISNSNKEPTISNSNKEPITNSNVELNKEPNAELIENNSDENIFTEIINFLKKLLNL